RYSAFPLILKEQLTARAVETAGPEVGVYGFGPGFYSGGGAAPQYRLELLGYSYGEVKRLAREIGRKLQRNPRVRDVDTNSSYRWRARDDLFEIALRVDRRKLQRFRLSSSDLLHTLESYLRESLDWHRIKLAGKEIDYRIKMAGHRDFQMADMQSLVIETPTHEQVRLDQVATIGERKVLAEIVRQNQQYLRGISFEYRGPWKYGDRLVKSIIENTHLPPGYKLQRARFFFLTEEQKSQIYLVFALAVLLVYMVTAALFESWSQPFVVILTVPLALIGVFLIFFFLDLNFDRSAYIGVILLAGIVVNNSIILVHHINDQRRTGLPLETAVIRGTRDRVRPILMTSATTILGLLPLVLFSRAEKSIWYALSVATIGGMLSSTLLVLLVTPVAYVILARFARSGGGDGLEPQRLRGI
ncbi:MAG: efflux RND transporter permease subunit, partial [Calditrichaeota bacterium]